MESDEQTEATPRPKGQDGRRLVFVAIAFYLVSAGVAVGWGALAGRPNVFVWGKAPPLETVGLHAAMGALFGAAVVGLSSLMVRRLRWAQELATWFAEILGPLRWRDSLVLALLSGVGEEMLFRGAMQPTLGLAASTAIFAIVHFPSEKRLIPWTLSAGLLGLVFGIAFELTRTLAFPIAAHFVINFVNLKGVGRFRPDQRQDGNAS